jgi:predicted HAD superfamily Cof-like phosphohydrolase
MATFNNEESIIKSIKEFNSSFGLPISKTPCLIEKEQYNLKYNLLKEELDEYLEACENKDLVEICDSIIDMFYVLSGFIVQHGIDKQFLDMFFEVHKSNMSKLENGKVLKRHDGKVMKGSEYFKPNLKQYL